MEKFESQQYRNDLAKEIKSEPDKEKRKEILEEAKEEGEYQEIKFEHRKEKCPASWLEYFDEPYPKVVQETINEHGLKNSEINGVLDGIVSEVSSIGSEVQRLEEKYKDILGESHSKYVDYVNLEDSVKEMQEILRANLVKESEEVPDLWKSIQWFIHSQFIMQDLSYLKLISSKREDVSESKLNAYEIQHFLQDKFHEGDYNSSRETFELIDKLNKDGGADIFYVAPRSALYTANIVKAALSYLSKHNDDIENPYFTFPKSKRYSSLNLYYNEPQKDIMLKERQARLKNLLLSYLMTSDADEKDKLKESIGDIIWEDAIYITEKNISPDSEIEIERSFINPDDVINLVVDLKNTVEKSIKKGKKRIRIAVYDEVVNTGRTTQALSEVVKIVQSYVEQTYDVDVEFSTYAFYKDTQYRAEPSHIKSSRSGGGGGKLESFSKSETPIARKTSALAYDIASIIGKYYGFAYNTRKKLKELGVLSEYSE